MKKIQKISSYSSLAEPHFKLINVLSFICYGSSKYYCFCEKYDSVEFDYNRGRQCCTLCSVLVEFCNFEILDRNEDNEEFSKKYLDNLKPATGLYALVMSRTRFRVNPHSICQGTPCSKQARNLKVNPFKKEAGLQINGLVSIW